MNEIIKKLNVMQVNNLKQYDNLLTKDNVGFRAYLLNDVEIYPEKCLYKLVQNPDTLAYEFAYAEDKTAKDLGSTTTNGYWYAGYHKYAKTLYNALDTIISALTTEIDCTIIIGLEKEQIYNSITFPSGMSKAVITPSTAIADIDWIVLDSTFVWETGHANTDYLVTPIIDDLEDVEKVQANANKLVYLNKSEVNKKGWYEIKETNTNKFEWIRVDGSNGEPIIQVDESELGLADNVVGTVLRHGNDVKFHFHYKALSTPINEIAATMPKPFAGLIPEFVAVTTTLDESLAVVATIDANGRLAFKDDAEVGDFTIDGAYYSSDWEPAEGWTPVDPAITEEYTEHTLTTDVEGKVFHFGNFISFSFKYDETDPITEIVTNMPFPIIDQNPEFVAVANVGGEEVPTVVKLLQNGTLEFVDTDGFNSFTVSGMYLSSNYEDWMEFDISMEKGIKQLTVMPEPIEAKEYQQVHYIGETNNDYTNNTIYICTRVHADDPADPDTFEWKEIVGQSIEVYDVYDKQHNQWLVDEWEGYRLYQYTDQGCPAFTENKGFFWLTDKDEWSKHGDFRAYGYKILSTGNHCQCMVSGDLGALTENEIKQLVNNGYTYAQSKGLSSDLNKSVDFYTSDNLTLGTHSTNPGWVRAFYHLTPVVEADKWEIVNLSVSDIESSMALGETFKVSSFTPGKAIVTEADVHLLDHVMADNNRYNRIVLLTYEDMGVPEISPIHKKAWYEVTEKENSNPVVYEWKEVISIGGDFIEQLDNLGDSIYELKEENVGKRAYLCKSKTYSKGWYVVNNDLTLKEVKEVDAKLILDGLDGQPRAGVVTYITPEMVSTWGGLTYNNLKDNAFCRIDTVTNNVVGGISGFATATMTDKNGTTVQEGDFVSIIVDKADDSSPLGNALVKGDIEQHCEFVKETCARLHSTRFAIVPNGYVKDVAEIEALKTDTIGKLILLPDNLKRDKTFYDITKEVVPAINYNNIYLIKWYGEALVPEIDYEFVSIDNTNKKYIVYAFDNKLTLTLLTAIHNKIKEYAEGDDYNAVIAGGVTTSFEYLDLSIPAGMFLGKLEGVSSTDPVLTSIDQSTFKSLVTSYRVANSLINTDYSDTTTPLYQTLDKLTLGIPVSYAFVQDEISTKTNIYWKKVQEGGGASEDEVEITLGTNWVKDGSVYQVGSHVYIDATFTYSGTTEDYDGIIISDGLPQPINPRIVEGITNPTMFPAMLPLQVTTAGKLVVYGTDKPPIGLVKVMFDYHVE